MFFFWGPFFFVFPAVLIYLFVRHLFGPGERGRRSKFFEDYDEFPNIEYGARTPKARHESKQVRIYKTADQLGGRLTVSDLVIETGMDVDEAERSLQSMVDNQRVRMEVLDDGLVVYEFPEIIARHKNQPPPR
ncbi:MAG TPA: hypothetical protein ENN41_03995 [Sediminispirochaeta sp.]|nr:hypothetical protein [Sediminispirochaeta sp.]